VKKRSRKGIVQPPNRSEKVFKKAAEEVFGEKLICPHGCNPATVRFSSEAYLAAHNLRFHTPRFGT